MTWSWGPFGHFIPSQETHLFFHSSFLSAMCLKAKQISELGLLSPKAEQVGGRGSRILSARGAWALLTSDARIEPH